MIGVFRLVDERLSRATPRAKLGLALFGVLVVGGIDYGTGFELSFSLFYLGPITLATWYAGRAGGVGVALLSCVSWYLADTGAGHHYSHPAIPVWNALVRLGFFLTTTLLLTALRESLRGQRQLASTDGLTGLYSRRAFDDRLRHDLAMTQRRGGALSLAYLDLDDFKAVNDTRGHAEGDKVLLAVGRAMQALVRDADTAARLGGDEFALVLPDADGAGAQQFVSRLRQELQRALGSGDWGVSCSIGVVTVLDRTTTMDAAIAAADQLMYEVKRSGKGAVAFGVCGAPSSQPTRPA